ncbi:MAG: hypothetical protein Ct9H90mP4_02900 [Gammaproteobacteria bacterium]|nr:MAG: hypothetical protein Ct9H90mP4_02900 [Gammaproteobacteria bacterium]
MESICHSTLHQRRVRKKIYSPSSYLPDEESDPQKIVEKEIDSQVNTKYLYTAIKELDERSKGIIFDRWLSDEKLTLHELAEKKWNFS